MRILLFLFTVFCILLTCSRDWDNPVDRKSEQENKMPTEGLVAYYPFNGNANDESGNRHNGLIYGPTLTLDRFGNSQGAYLFDGIDDYIVVPHSSKFNFGKQFSIAAWIKPIEWGENSYGRIIDKSDARDIVGYRLLLSNSGFSTDDFETFGLSLNDGNIGVRVISPKKTLSLNSFNFVAATYDGEYVTLYFNTKLVKKEGIAILSSLNNSGNLILGNRTNQDRTFDGVLDEIWIYNRALSDEEVQALYHEGGWGE